MGYHTDFAGFFTVSPPLRPQHLVYLRKFNSIRHEKRDPDVASRIPDPLREAVGLPLGPDASFFVGAKSWYENSGEDPTTFGEGATSPSQPGSFYCQWVPTDDGSRLVWDEGEKFYEYIEWLQYMITNFLAPWGYVVGGAVGWEGEEYSDVGTIVVTGNEISVMGAITVSARDGSLRRLRVFLCHASPDKEAVRRLYRRLQEDRLEPWLDEEDLIPGQDWEHEIRRAIKQSDIVLVCLSRSSVSKIGFVQKEIRLALDVADEQPEGKVFVVPVRLEECDVPERLRRWHWVDLFSEDGYGRLWRSLEARAAFLSENNEGGA